LPTHAWAHLRLVRELLASRDLRAVVDRTYVNVDASHYVETERKPRGVITVT
jgi:hypothetical protein